MKNAVITGASSGIGKAAVEELLQNGYRVFGSVRKEEDAQRLRAELGANFHPLLFDVCDEGAIREGAEKVKHLIGNAGLNLLVNNAGISVPGPLQEVSTDDFRRQFEVNVIGLIAVTQAFLPLLGAVQDSPFPPGRIINISSVSGEVGFPFLSPYVASKHAVEGISKCLRRELLGFGVDVITIAPGQVITPIWDKIPELDAYPNSAYSVPLKKTKKAMLKMASKGLPVKKLGELIYKVAEARKPRIRYVPVPNRWMDLWIPRYAPQRWLDRVIGKSLGILKK